MRFSQVTTVSLFVVTAVTGFSIHHGVRIIRPRTMLCTSTYGRGAEIWPECNEDSINLADSFPGGVVPSQPTPPPAAETSPLASIDKTPAGIALALLVGGLVRPLDVLVATGIGGYLTVLHFLAKAPRSDGVTPHVPALPPQGHVPDLVLNPLGVFFTKSKEYDSWLKAGTVLSLLAPVAAIAKYTLMSSNNQMAAARACARPLFLLCCQAVVESISRGVMVRVWVFDDKENKYVKSFDFFTLHHLTLVYMYACVYIPGFFAAPYFGADCL